MLILDSTVLIDLLGNKSTPQTDWLHTNAYSFEMAITDLILCETLQGVRNPQEFARVQAKLEDIPCFNTGGKEIATSAARNYSLLRNKGITVRKTIDCIIATFCIEQDHTLLHHDRDFDHFERELGLKVVEV